MLFCCLTKRGSILNGIGARLREIRREFNRSQQEVADVLMMKQSQYSRVEADKSTVPVDKLVDLADFYGVSVDYLLGHNCSRDPASLETKLRESGLKYSFVGDRVSVRLLGKVFYVKKEVMEYALALSLKKSSAVYSKVTQKIIESFLCSILLKKADDGDFDVDMD